MSISQKLENSYKNQIENIKNEKNYISRIRQVGALVLDVGGRCISAIAKAIGSCRDYVKKCANIVTIYSHQKRAVILTRLIGCFYFLC